MPKNTTSVLGESVTFEIKIISDLHPSWTWFKQKCSNDSVCDKVKIEVKEMKCLHTLTMHAGSVFILDHVLNL